MRDLLLMLLRVLAILFLVLAFAQPYISKRLIGGANLETIIIWDVSLSTQAVSTDGLNIQNSLKQSVLNELEQLPNRSRVRILLAGAETRWLGSGSMTLSRESRAALEKAIQAQPVDDGGGYIGDAIQVAMAALDNDQDFAGERHVVVVHDSSRVAWQADDSARWEGIRRRLDVNDALTLEVVDPQFEPALHRPQLVLNSLKPDDEVLYPGASTRFRASISNHSDIPISDVILKWKINGELVTMNPGNTIPPGEDFMAEQLLSFDSPGWHRVECEVMLLDDVLPSDNVMASAIAVMDGLPVIVVDDSQRTQKGEILPSEFFSAALGQPLVAQKDRDKNPASDSIFRPQTVRSHELDEVDLSHCYAVVITHAGDLSLDATNALGEFVDGGGGLWVMLNSTEEELPVWCVDLFKQVGLKALGASRRQVASTPKDQIKVTAADPDGDYATGMAVRRFDMHRLELGAIQQPELQAYLEEELLLKTLQGQPVLLSLSVGVGKVVLQTTDISRQNTNFPVLQSFVPFVRETMSELTRTALPKYNLSPGEPLRIPLTGRQNADQKLQIKRPDGTLRDLVMRSGAYELSDTMLPGSYALIQDDMSQPQEFFMVQRDAAESDLESISSDEIGKLVTPKSRITLAGGQEPAGRRPLAWLFLVLMAICFLAEAILAHLISRRRNMVSAPIELKPVF